MQFFFVLLDLLLQFGNHLINRTEQIVGLVTGKEVVPFFGLNSDLDVRFISLIQVHGYVNGGQTVEKTLESFDFLFNFFLGRVANITVPCRNVDLHNNEEKPVWIAAGKAPRHNRLPLFYQKSVPSQEGKSDSGKVGNVHVLFAIILHISSSFFILAHIVIAGGLLDAQKILEWRVV